jgi:MFS transporter, FSR family, fosmidomycin resistance protein
MTRTDSAGPIPAADPTAFGVILAVSFCHLLNDMMQSLLPSIYPNLQMELSLSFSQIGLVTLVYQATASLLQPVVGLYGDKRPTPLALPCGPLFSLAGLAVLSITHSYWMLLVSALLLGIGSSMFHPECSRVVRMAAGNRPGLGQSLFQVGGNTGTALGPLAAAVVVVKWGQSSLVFFALLALLSGAVLWNVSQWVRHDGMPRMARLRTAHAGHARLPRVTVSRGIIILLALIFSKYVYLASITTYHTFYLIHRFGIGVKDAQLYLFAFLAAVALGTVIGGPLGDRHGRKFVIWLSILGTLPFTLLLPHATLQWSAVLTIIIGLLLASAFPAIVVFAQELVPGKVGVISGLFFGFSFGMAGIGAATLGVIADSAGIEAVYKVCAYLPAFGLLAVFLPQIRR